MSSWRDLVIGEMGQDMQARKNASVGPAFKEALKNLTAMEAEKRKGKMASRLGAEEAAYKAFPGAAAKAAGIDIGGAGGTPEGMRETKRTVGGSVYEAPDVMDETGIAKIFTNYVTKIQSQNAMNSKYPGYEPIEVPSLASFTKEFFPEYLDVIRSKKGQIGAGDPNIQDIIDKEKAKGTPVGQIKEYMRAKDLNPDDYEI